MGCLNLLSFKNVLFMSVQLTHAPVHPQYLCVALTTVVQWNPSIVATIRDQHFGFYGGVATSQGLFYIIDKTCTCMV